MMTAEQQAGLERFAHFLGEMIAKYGVDVLAEWSDIIKPHT